jgi:hypothetical protein
MVVRLEGRLQVMTRMMLAWVETLSTGVSIACGPAALGCESGAEAGHPHEAGDADVIAQSAFFARTPDSEGHACMHPRSGEVRTLY